jgi:hypothetical protein
MSESNKQVQGSYPKGSGTTAVPILFSLRNVQPSLVKGAIKDSAKDATIVPAAEMKSNTTAVATAVLPPSPKAATMAKLPKPGNRIYNGTIALLVVILCFIVFRNTQVKSNSGLSPVLAGINKTGSDSKKTDGASTTATASVNNAPINSNSPIATSPTPLVLTANSSNASSQSSFDRSSTASLGTASVNLLNPRPEPKHDEGLKIPDTSMSGPSSLSAAKTEVGMMTPPVLPPLPSNPGRDAQESLTLGEPETGSLSKNAPSTMFTSSAKPRNDGADAAMSGELSIGPDSSQVPFAMPAKTEAAAQTRANYGAEAPTAVSRTTPSNTTQVSRSESVVDTGVELTTKELIEAFRAGPSSAPAANVPASSNMNINSAWKNGNSGQSTNSSVTEASATVPARSVSYTPIGGSAAAMKPYTPITQPQSAAYYPTTSNVAPANTAVDTRDAMAQAVSQANPQVMVGQAYPPLPKESQPVSAQNNSSLAIPAYEQYAMDPNKSIPLSAAASNRQPADANANRYQGMAIQQPATTTSRTPYSPTYPSQGSVPSGTPIGYPPK